MRYKAKTGTVINIPNGASPKQIAQIKARADQGYGVEAQNTANKIGKGAGKIDPGGVLPAGQGNADVSGKDLTQGNQNSISAAEGYIDNLIKNMKPIDTSGAPKLLSDGDINAERQSVYDSNYKLQTQGVEQHRAQDLEAQKQELANRGIPYNPGTDPSDPNNVNNVYARSLNNVNQRYDTINQNAAAAANSAADSSLATYVGANKTQNDQYLDTQRTAFQSQLDSLAGAGGALGQLMQQYGIDKQTAQDILNRRTQVQIAHINNQRSGGGGGGGGSSGGFGIPGIGGSVS